MSVRLSEPRISPITMSTFDNGTTWLKLQPTAAKIQSQMTNTSSTTVASAILFSVLVYQILYHFDYDVLPLSELLWNSAIFVTPARLVSALESAYLPMDPDQDKDKSEYSNSKSHAKKSDTMRRVLGLQSMGILGKVQQRTTGLPGVGSLIQSKSSTGPPGLGNWDNSCYQNSVIQGLASLPSFSTFLDQATIGCSLSNSTQAALKDIIEKLKDPANKGNFFWTPAQLKSMSSWQQQDAQEYYSKVMDEIEKEVTKSVSRKSTETGLAAFQDLDLDSSRPTSVKANDGRNDQASSLNKFEALKKLPEELQAMTARNPLEGLLAQRVGCLQCGYVEGLSLIPFNCLTLPLGNQWLYDVRSCLDEYTTLEPINGVDCGKCTLLRRKAQFEKTQAQLSSSNGQELGSAQSLVTEALRVSVEERLAAVNDALENDDYSENTILKKCLIPQKNKVSSTKSRQAVIARAPRSLAIHINRSVFNEMTGMLSKNSATVRFPLRFSLASWCLGSRELQDTNDANIEWWNTDPSQSMLPKDIPDDSKKTDKDVYELRAVLTHYGRHENGHYICYRRHMDLVQAEDTEVRDNVSSWWRFSDEDVSAVSEDTVLSQGGVFMLFYEKVETQQPTAPATNIPTAIQRGSEVDLRIEAVSPLHQDHSDEEAAAVPSTEAQAEDDGKPKASTALPSHPSLDKSSENTISTAPDAVTAPTPDTESPQTDTAEHCTPSPSSHSVSDLAADSAPAPPLAATEPLLLATDSPTQTDISSHSPSATQNEPITSIPSSSDGATTIASEHSSSPTSTTDEAVTDTSLSTSPEPQFPPDDHHHEPETKSLSPPMRTVTPRSGRGSMGGRRDGKGLGQVSSMVTAN